MPRFVLSAAQLRTRTSQRAQSAGSVRARCSAAAAAGEDPPPVALRPGRGRRSGAAQQAAWQARVAELVAFRSQHGHEPRARCADVREASLGEWLQRQRNLHRKGEVTPERVADLDAAGVCWDPQPERWEASFSRWQQASADAAKSQSRLPEELCVWETKQRKRLQAGTMSAERIARLDASGFDWAPHDEAWEEHFQRLRAFTAGHGRTNVPKRYEPDLPLGAWVHRQRRDGRNGKMSKQQRERLDAIGFQWEG